MIETATGSVGNLVTAEYQNESAPTTLSPSISKSPPDVGT
jgi:hypothetical protein